MASSPTGVVGFWALVGSDEELKALRIAADNIPGVGGIDYHMALGPSYL
jgi:hypothetical protein